MDEVMEAAAKYAAKIITTQIIPGIVIYNFGEATEFPTLAPVINSPIDLFNLAQAYNILFNQMKIPVLNKELYARIEFTPPEDDDDVYEPPAAPQPPAIPFGTPHPQPFGTRPEPAGAPFDKAQGRPNGSKEPGAKPNIVERVGAAGLGDRDCCDPDFDDAGEGQDGIAVPARKVSFALDYGEEPEPGEVLRFLETVEARREPGTTTVLEPKQLDRSPAEAAVSHDTAQYFRENAATIKGVKWKSVMDDRTTPECVALNGKRWTYPDLKPIGHDLEFPDFPPIKYNCRSSVMPVLKTWPQIQRWLKGIFKR
jgi:SPP1 gp7 family putative phage head morphogenesis protein